MKSLWKFRQHGQSGQWVSDLFPHIGRHVDDLCFLHGMHTEGIAHGPATLFLHTGSINLVRPSIGAWVTYGLGTENQNLPGFVTHLPVDGQRRPAQLEQRLPAGRLPGHADRPRRHPRQPRRSIRNLANDRRRADEQRQQFDLLQALNAEQLPRAPGDAELEAVIDSFELAFRMQTHAPDILDLPARRRRRCASTASASTATDNFGRQCLMARRLAEAGVRYVQVNYGDNTDNPAWDQHSNLPKHADHALAVDQPVAGLLADLKRRGLLEDTLVWWGGEFGRTPYAERNGTGRDHNPDGFTVWLAGGGVKPGFVHGATDEFGHHAVAGQGPHARPARHAPAPARPRPRTPDLPLRRPRFPPDRRRGAGGEGDHRVIAWLAATRKSSDRARPPVGRNGIDLGDGTHSRLRVAANVT